MNRILKFFTLVFLLGLSSLEAQAGDILCKDDTINHMLISDLEVSDCLDAGAGNLSGNPGGAHPDPFLTGVGTGLNLVSKSDEANPFNLAFTFDTQDGVTEGTWSFDVSYWNLNTAGALGFKFGTGGESDEWFVYELVQGIFTGDFKFLNLGEWGGGLSHTNLYGVNVSAPGTISLLGLGLIWLGVARHRRRSSII